MGNDGSSHRRPSISLSAIPLALPIHEEERRLVYNLCLGVGQAISLRPDFREFSEQDIRLASILSQRYKTDSMGELRNAKNAIAISLPMVFARMHVSISRAVRRFRGFPIRRRRLIVIDAAKSSQKYRPPDSYLRTESIFVGGRYSST